MNAPPESKQTPWWMTLVAAVVMFAAACGENTNSGPPPEATVDVNALKARAEKGEADAQYAYGKHFIKEVEYKEAAKWLQLAADQGNAGGQLALGQLHEVGQGVAKDEAKAAELFRKSAEQGNAAAQFSLASLYIKGAGVTMDVNETIKWLRRAADQGDSLAQLNLGVRYYDGNGVAADLVEAYQWLTLAKAQGDVDPTKTVEGLTKKMSPVQLAEGKRRVEAFVAKPEPVKK
jgi:uncharacterized protein